MAMGELFGPYETMALFCLEASADWPVLPDLTLNLLPSISFGVGTTWLALGLGVEMTFAVRIRITVVYEVLPRRFLSADG